MDARRRTLRLKRGGAPVSDTPYSDIEFPLKLRKWKESEIMLLNDLLQSSFIK